MSGKSKKSKIMTSDDKMAMSQIAELIKTTLREEINNATMENFLAKEVKVETNVRAILKIVPDKHLMIIEMDSYMDKENTMKNKQILKGNRKF